MSYYDPDAILTDAQKLPCTFQLDIPDLGYMDDNAGNKIKKDTTLPLPLWLGTMLAVSPTTASQSTNLVTMDFPDPLRQRVLNALKADPCSVDLRAQAPHFYAVAARCLDLFEDDGVLDVLIDTMRARASRIADHAHNARSSTLTTSSSGGGAEGAAEFLQGLDETERRLFRSAHDGAKAVRNWSLGLQKKG